MNNLVYRKGDLFSAEVVDGATNLLVHACNCQGVWGSGIAKKFAEKFPLSYDTYKKRTALFRAKALGTAAVFPKENGFYVTALYTSDLFGPLVSPPLVILDATKHALYDLEAELDFEPNVIIHSPKINAGLFKTPWEDTEKLIIDFLSVRPDIVWTVWELE